ncbi:hypothetical protein ACROYT_G013342 [Oculina patagonica]
MNQAPGECSNGVGNVLKRSKAFVDTKLAIIHLESNRNAKEVLSILHEETPNESLLQQHYSYTITEKYFREDDGSAAKAEGKPFPSWVAKGGVVKTQDPLHQARQNYFAKNVYVLNDPPRVLVENQTRNPYLQTRKEKDMTAAKAFLPDFFPRQLVQDNYDYLQTQPTLEQIFSGHEVLTGN